MTTGPRVSIIVANWEGERWLSRCLSSLQISARAAGWPYELLVVDDASSDSSVRLVREGFPRARLLRNRKNVGFARSINRGVASARGQVVVLVNNDLLVREEIIHSLCRWFLAPHEELGKLGGRWEALPLHLHTFAVSARTVGWYDGRPNQLCMGAKWRGGRLTPAFDDPAGASLALFAPVTVQRNIPTN